MTRVHRAVILLGLLLAAFGALLGTVLWQLGSPLVPAATIVTAGVLAVLAGLWLRRRERDPDAPPVEDVPPTPPPVESASPPSEALRLWPAEADAAIATGPAPVEAPVIPVEAPVIAAQEVETLERQAVREAELAREAELNAIADELRSLRSRDLSSTHIPAWKGRIETWVDADLRARADRGEEVHPQAAEWMRDFGEIPVKDWRRHLLRHLRRLGYRNYREGEW